jgi:hypothetical protein
MGMDKVVFVEDPENLTTAHAQLEVASPVLTGSLEIPHSENADVEYYTTYPKTTEKTGATRFPKGTPNSVTCTTILYYYHSMKKNTGEISNKSSQNNRSLIDQTPERV